MGGHDKEDNTTIGTKQSLLVQAPCLRLQKRRMTCSQSEKLILKPKLDSLILQIILEDSDKKLSFTKIVV